MLFLFYCKIKKLVVMILLGNLLIVLVWCGMLFISRFIWNWGSLMSNIWLVFDMCCRRGSWIKNFIVLLKMVGRS